MKAKHKTLRQGPARLWPKGPRRRLAPVPTADSVDLELICPVLLFSARLDPRDALTLDWALGRLPRAVPVTRKQLEGSRWKSWVHPDDQQALLAWLNALHEGEHGSFDFRARFQSPAPSWLRLSLHLREAHHRGDRGFVGALQDVDQHRHELSRIRSLNEHLAVKSRFAQIALHTRDEQLFHRVLDIILELLASPLGVLGYLDADGTLVCPTLTREAWWSQCQIPNKGLRFPRKSWAGTWGDALVTGHSQLRNEDLKVPSGHVSLRCALSVPILFRDEVIGQITVGNKGLPYTDEDRQRLEDLAAAFAPILHAQLGRLRERARRERAEQALRASERSLRELVDALPQQVARLDAQARFLMANASLMAATESQGEEEIRGRTPREIMGPDVGGRLEAHLQRALRGEPVRFQERWKNASGEDRHYDGELLPVTTETGAVEGVYSVQTDITRHKQAERNRLRELEQKRQAEQLASLERLTTGIAHEFNNVLAVIGGNVSLLSMELDPTADPDKEEILRDVSQATDRASRLVSKLVAFGRREPTRLEDVSVQKLLDSLEPRLLALTGNDVALSLQRPSGELTIRTTPDALTTVVLQLAKNAVEAMPRGGTLRIAVTPERRETAEPLPGGGESPAGEYLRLDVEDTGDGMSDEVLARIYEPFFTTRNKATHAGLGLSVAHGTARRLGAPLHVRSTVGEGTRFSLYLPRKAQLRRQTPALVGREGAAVDAPSAAASARVLVVDDEPAVLRVITTLLERQGIRVQGQQDSREAVALVEGDELGFDLLVTDVVMSGINGIELADRLWIRHPATPVLFMSGYSRQHLDLKDLASEHTRFLSKPFQPAQLMAILGELLPQ